MRLYQFAATATANTSIQMLTKGVIVGVVWSMATTSGSAGDGIVAELSFSGVSQTTVNNPVGIISIAREYVNAISAASTFSHGVNFSHFGLYCPVGQGDLIYLNTVITGGAFVRALLHIQEGR